MMTLTRRQFGMAGAALAGLSMVPSGALFAADAAVPPAPIDPMSLVDPDLKPVLQAWLKQSRLPAYNCAGSASQYHGTVSRFARLNH